MELNEMTAAELREHAKSLGLDIRDARSKTALIKKISEAQAPAKQPEKIALHTDHNLYHPLLGRLNKGYNILAAADADLWLKAVGKRVRVATPQEVAAFYGV